MSAPSARPGALVTLKLVACMALWGGTWVSGRVLAPVLSPYVAGFVRFCMAGAFLYLLLCRAEGRLPRLSRELLPGVVFLAFAGVLLYNALFFSGLARIPAGRAALIVACVPSAVALYSALFLGVRGRPLRYFGIALSLFGVAVILSHGDLPGLMAHGVEEGDLYILGCVAAWSAYSIAGARVMRTVSPLAAVTWSCVLGCAMLFPPALATGLLQQMRQATWQIWANLAFLGFAATGLAYTWYYDGIRALGAGRASVFINLVPVFATGLAALILGEGLGLSLAIGGAMVLAGVTLANRPDPAKAAKSAS